MKFKPEEYAATARGLDDLIVYSVDRRRYFSFPTEQIKVIASALRIASRATEDELARVIAEDFAGPGAVVGPNGRQLAKAILKHLSED